MATDLTRRTFVEGFGAVGAGLLATGATGGETRTPVDPGPVDPAMAVRDAPEFEAFFDERVPALLDEHDLAGGTVAVVADGEVELAKGYGYADVRADEPVRADDTLFRVASASKPVTGTAVMRAVEAGHVELGADVNEYLDTFAIPDGGFEPVTLEHLGTHTAGFEAQYLDRYARDPVDRRPLVDVLEDDPPDRIHPPGSLASYSNYGIALAGYAAGAAAGTTFSEYVRDTVFDPLGMDRSTFDAAVPDGIDGVLTKTYDFDEDAVEFREIDAPYELRRPAGAMATTATDMAQFMLMHLQGGRFEGEPFLAEQTVAGMHDRRFSNHPAIDGFGYMFLERSRGDTRIVGHGGRLRGVASELLLFPERGLGLFVAFNTTGGDDASEPLVDAFVEAYAPPGDPDPIEPDGPPARADELAGWYRTTRVPDSPVGLLFGIGGTVEVRVEADGTLVTAPTAPGVEPIRWAEVQPLVFRAVEATPQVSRFDRLAFGEEDGEITYLFLRGPSDTYRRLGPHESPWLHVGITLAFLVLFVGGVLGWAGAAGRRWYRDAPSPDRRPQASRWLAAVTGLVLVSVPIGLLTVLAGGQAAIGYGLPGWFQVVRALSVVGALGAVATVGAAIAAWRAAEWRLAGRLHYSLLAVTGIAFAGLLAYWGLLWSPFG